MSKANEILNEIFGSKGIPSSKIRYEHEIYKMYETIGGRKFVFTAMIFGDIADITFFSEKQGTEEGNWVAKTTPLDDPRDVFRIISTTIGFVKTVLDLEKKRNNLIHQIGFTANPGEKSKVRLYSRILSMAVKVIPGATARSHLGAGSVNFFITIP